MKSNLLHAHVTVQFNVDRISVAVARKLDQSLRDKVTPW
jgi:hypothetical protein